MSSILSYLPSEEIAKITAIINAAIDTDAARQLGYKDGEAGKDQNGIACFIQFSSQWHAYNDGYRAGTLVFVAKTGKTRSCIIAGHRRLNVETIDAQNPFAGAFQGNYADILPDYQREDYVGS